VSLPTPASVVPANPPFKREESAPWIVAGLTLLGAALRFWHIGSKSLGLDEGSTVALARMPWRHFAWVWWRQEGNMTPDAGEDERTHLSDLNSGRTPWRRVWVVLSEPGILRQDSNQLSPQLPWELQDRYGPPAIHDYTPLLLCWSTGGKFTSRRSVRRYCRSCRSGCRGLRDAGYSRPLKEHRSNASTGTPFP